MEFSSKNSFHNYKYQHTYVPHQSHNWVFLFLMDTTCQATIHTQPRSSNIFIQHNEDIITQHGICKDTDTSNYIKPRMKNASQHELNVREIINLKPSVLPIIYKEQHKHSPCAYNEYQKVQTIFHDDTYTYIHHYKANWHVHLRPR